MPPSLETQFNESKVCRLRKSLYDLKQSPKTWFERLTKAVKCYGYSKYQTNHTLFIKYTPYGKTTILIVYVNDIILTRNDEEEIQSLKNFLATKFEIKDLGILKYFIGTEIVRSRKGIAVSQRKYVLDLLKETEIVVCKPAETPMDYLVKLGSIEGSAPMDKRRYQWLVGKLIYLSHTWSDIGFPISAVS